MITWTEKDYCIDCGKQPRLLKRRLCYSCYRETKNKVRRVSPAVESPLIWHKCSACEKQYANHCPRKGQICMNCWKESCNLTLKGRGYFCYKNGLRRHIQIATKVLNRRILKKESIHHLDLNQSNDILSNLILMLKSNHSSIHNLLRLKWIIESKHNRPFNIIEETWKIIKENNWQVTLLSDIQCTI